MAKKTEKKNKVPVGEPASPRFPRFSPIAYFGGNLLISGLSYILLRQYMRFFILMGLFITLSSVDYIGYVLIIASAFDAYFIAKKLKSGQAPVPEYKGLYTWIAVLIYAALIAFWFYAAVTQYQPAVPLVPP